MSVKKVKAPLNRQKQQKETNAEAESTDWFQTVQRAALQAKATFPDQMDNYDPEINKLV
ncbi:hypothetical protein O9H85_09880 [Paenibacillus filicis]|uniref:Uncharacterized protein n=1 Tax=Paenibacillus gyeongsangnamensis TaxID=3388067 RepID=A0ABT4Q770_9BACL|nr:hypothetical protein [Paenibacillus filicis]MCZ8512717.1 hypothetical protein [Paenibacillus filicis]